MTIAETLGLKAENKMEERLLEYLSENVSDVLSFKIQSGDKTIQGAVDHIKAEVKATIAKSKQSGSVGIWVDDQDVYNMMIHFFEEDSIKEPNKPKKQTKVEPPKAEPVEPVDNTLVMDLFGSEECPFK